MHEDPSRFDRAPPWKRIDVVLRLDNLVQVEQSRKLIERFIGIANMRGRHDDFLARGETNGCANRIALLRTSNEVTRDPPQDAAVLIERRRRRWPADWQSLKGE